MSTSSYMSRDVGLLHSHDRCSGRYVHLNIFVKSCLAASYMSLDVCLLYHICHEMSDCFKYVKWSIYTLSHLSRIVDCFICIQEGMYIISYLSHDFRLLYMCSGRNVHFIKLVTRCLTALYVSRAEFLCCMSTLSYLSRDVALFYVSRKVCPLYNIFTKSWTALNVSREVCRLDHIRHKISWTVL
jgi:hypothetical protein